MSGVLTVSGNEITDNLRKAQGPVDGFLAGTGVGFGVWGAQINQCLCTNFQSSPSTVWNAQAGATISFVAEGTEPFPSHLSCKIVTAGTVQGMGMPGTKCPASVSGDTWTIVVAVKAGANATTAYLRLQELNASNVSTGTHTTNVTITSGTPLGNGWYLLTATATCTGATTAKVRWDVGCNQASATMYVLAPMWSKTAYGYPYIVNSSTTQGVTATRNAGRVQAPASLLTATQGWIAAVIEPGYASPQLDVNRFVFSWETDASNYLAARVQQATDGFDAVNDYASTQSIAHQSMAWAADQEITVIVAWDAVSVYVSVNGAAFTASSPANRVLPNGSLFDIASLANVGHVNGNVQWFACGIGVLSSTDATALATLLTGASLGTTSLFPEDVIAVAGNSVCTAIWGGVTATYQNEVFVILDESGLLPRIRVDVDATTNPTVATRAWTDITARVRQISWQRSGRNQELNRSTAGSLTAVCDDRAAAVTGLGLRKRQWVRVRARWQGIESPRWQGIFETLPRKWPGEGADQLVELNAADAFKILGLTDLAGQTFPSQRNDQRVRAILGLAGVAAGSLDTDTDMADAVTTPFAAESMALDYLLQIEASENGLLIANPDGTVDFQGRHWRFLHSGQPLGVFGETGDTIPYLDDAEYDDDDSLIVNIAAVTPYGASTAVVAVNTASTARNWPTRTDVQLLSSNAGLASDAANWLTRRYGDPSPRIPALTTELGAAARVDPALVTGLLNGENSSRFTWNRAASPPISEDVYVEQIAETVDVVGGGWRWKAQVSPAGDDAMWVAQNAVFGVAQVTTVGGY